jgi:tRNA threonylcarbamoyladenosine biosynthesis protein TsaE
MTVRTSITRSAAETRQLGARLGQHLRGGEVVLLCGDLGAGKTQFAQGVGEALQVATAVVSPTFTLAVEYAGRLPLVHYDLYRVERASELREVGFLEHDDPRTVSLVEWADRIDVALPAIRVVIRVRGDTERQIEITGIDLDAGTPGASPP